MSRLAEQMSFYAAYHQDPRNKLTHVFGVPTIVFAILLAMAAVPLPGVGVTLAVAFVAVLMVYYIYLDWLIGLTLGLLTVPVLALAHLVAALPTGFAVGIGVATFVGGWIVQLIGHRFEGNKPALTANLLQVFVAPLFLTAELFFALGLRKDVEAEVNHRIRAMTRAPGDAVRA